MSFKSAEFIDFTSDIRGGGADVIGAFEDVFDDGVGANSAFGRPKGFGKVLVISSPEFTSAAIVAIEVAGTPSLDSLRHDVVFDTVAVPGSFADKTFSSRASKISI